MRQKTLFLWLGVLFIVALFLVFLPSTTTQTITPKIPKEETLVLRLGHNTPIDSALHAASERLAAHIAQKTGNKVRIDIFPNQELGTDDEMIEMTREGRLDIVLTPTAKLSILEPSLQYADLPFYFQSREELYEMLDGTPGRMLLEALTPMGLVGVTFWENGFKQFTSNTPITSPLDFQGKKFRVMKSRLIMDQFRLLGAKPVSIDFHATRQALQDKVVDGQENPLVAIYSMGFYQHQKYLTLSDHAYLGYVVSFSAKTLSTLPSDIQMLLMDTARDITPWEREETKRKETKLLEAMREQGVHISTLNSAQKHAFTAVLAPLAKQYEDLIGAHIISKTEALRLEKNPQPHSVLIGLSSDLSMGTKVAGLALKRGLELAIAKINAQGGIAGKKVQLLAMDHKGLSTLGVRHIDEMLSKPNLIAIFGGLHSAVIVAQKELFHTRRVPFMIPWGAARENVQARNNHVFRVSVNDAHAGPFLAKTAMKKGKKPLIIYEASIWGAGAYESMRTQFAAHGITSLQEISFLRSEQFTSHEVKKALSTLHYDVVILIANPVEGTQILPLLAEKKVPVIAHWGILGSDFFAHNKSTLAQIDFAVLTTFLFDTTPSSKSLEHTYRSAYGVEEEILAPHGIAQAYDAMGLLAHAGNKAKSLEGSALIDALCNIEQYDGVITTYKNPFSVQNREAIEPHLYRLSTFNSKGRLVPYDQGAQ